MKTIETAGRRMLFWGALMMIGWAMYELSIRFDEMVIWLSPVFALVRDGQLTLWDYFSRVNWARLTTHLFLVLCVLLGVYALLARKRPILVLLSVPSAILLGVFFLLDLKKILSILVILFIKIAVVLLFGNWQTIKLFLKRLLKMDGTMIVVLILFLIFKLRDN